MKQSSEKQIARRNSFNRFGGNDFAFEAHPVRNCYDPQQVVVPICWAVLGCRDGKERTGLKWVRTRPVERREDDRTAPVRMAQRLSRNP
jgi:hypothetical protein